MDRKKDELAKIARQLGIKGVSRMRKDELLAAIIAHQHLPSVAPPAPPPPPPPRALPTQQLFNLGGLPDEMVVEVCKNLDQQSLYMALGSSKRVNDLCKHLKAPIPVHPNTIRVYRWNDAPDGYREMFGDRHQYIALIPLAVYDYQDDYPWLENEVFTEHENGYLVAFDERVVRPPSSFYSRLIAYVPARAPRALPPIPAIQGAHVKIWNWGDAPLSLRGLSTNGGDEDRLAWVPMSLVPAFDAHELAFLNQNTFANLIEVIKHQGGYVVIGSHG